MMVFALSGKYFTQFKQVNTTIPNSISFILFSQTFGTIPHLFSFFLLSQTFLQVAVIVLKSHQAAIKQALKVFPGCARPNFPYHDPSNFNESIHIVPAFI